MSQFNRAIDKEQIQKTTKNMEHDHVIALKSFFLLRISGTPDYFENKTFYNLLLSQTITIIEVNVYNISDRFQELMRLKLLSQPAMCSVWKPIKILVAEY